MTKREVWHPPAYEQADIRAVQALALYAQSADVTWPVDQAAPEPSPPPSPHETKRALDWIIWKGER